MKPVKGTYGYLKKQRNRYIVIVTASLAGVFAIFFIARAVLGTNANIFSIIAALLCLPAGRAAVNLVMLCRAVGCSESAHKAIEEHIGDLVGMYDLYLTTYEKNFALSHLVVRGKNVIALTEDGKCDTKAGEAHIRKTMQASGYHGYGVKIFDRQKAYIDRMDQLKALGEDKEDEKKNEGICILLKKVAL